MSASVVVATTAATAAASRGADSQPALAAAGTGEATGAVDTNKPYRYAAAAASYGTDVEGTAVGDSKSDTIPVPKIKQTKVTRPSIVCVNDLVEVWGQARKNCWATTGGDNRIRAEQGDNKECGIAWSGADPATSVYKNPIFNFPGPTARIVFAKDRSVKQVLFSVSAAEVPSDPKAAVVTKDIGAILSVKFVGVREPTYVFYPPSTETTNIWALCVGNPTDSIATITVESGKIMGVTCIDTWVTDDPWTHQSVTEESVDPQMRESVGSKRKRSQQSERREFLVNETEPVVFNHEQSIAVDFTLDSKGAARGHNWNPATYGAPPQAFSTPEFLVTGAAVGYGLKTTNGKHGLLRTGGYKLVLEATRDDICALSFDVPDAFDRHCDGLTLKVTVKNNRTKQTGIFTFRQMYGKTTRHFGFDDVHDDEHIERLEIMATSCSILLCNVRYCVSV